MTIRWGPDRWESEMSDTFAQFEKRLENLERKHRELAKGYVACINPDGLITVEPRRKRSYLLAQLVVLVLLGVILFKSVTLAIVGLSTYEDRIAALMQGTVFERVCGWIMQADPLTSKIATYFVTTFG